MPAAVGWQRRRPQVTGPREKPQVEPGSQARASFAPHPGWHWCLCRGPWGKFACLSRAAVRGRATPTTRVTFCPPKCVRSAYVCFPHQRSRIREVLIWGSPHSCGVEISGSKGGSHRKSASKDKTNNNKQHIQADMLPRRILAWKPAVGARRCLLSSEAACLPPQTGQTRAQEFESRIHKRSRACGQVKRALIANRKLFHPEISWRQHFCTIPFLQRDYIILNYNILYLHMIW